MNLRFLFEFPQSYQEKKTFGLLLLTITLLSEAVFLSKPVHIDDNIYLFPAQKFYALSKYYEGPYYLFGERHETLIRATHPPLVPFINFLIFQFSSQFKEVIFHLIYLGFTVGAIFFTYMFGLRFCRQPVLATLLLLFSPGFFVVSQNLMTDIILYTFLLGAFVLFLDSVDRGGCLSLAGGIILFALAIFTGFQAVVFFPIFFVYCWFKNRARISYAFLMGLALLPTILWYAYHFSVIDQIPDPIQMDILDESGRRAKIIYFLSNFSLAFVAPLGLLAACLTRKQIPSGILSLVLSYILFETVGDSLFQGYSIIQKGVLFLGGIISIWILLESFRAFVRPSWRQNLKDPDKVFLNTTIWIYLPVCLVFTPFAAGRYLIPIMIFVYILILREAETIRRGIILGTIICCVNLSFLAGWADFKLAAFYKDLTDNRSEFDIDPKKTWYMGEWGFRFYMEKTGYRYLAKDSMPQPGDWIIRPAIPATWNLDSAGYPLSLKKEFSFWDPLRFKVFNREAHAGFWSQGWGLLPFWPSLNPLERVRFYQVLPEPIPFAFLNVSHKFRFPNGASPQTQSKGQMAETVLRLKPGEHLQLSATIPNPSHLHFRIRIQNANSFQTSLFRLTVISENREQNLLEYPLSIETGKSISSWNELKADLTPFQNRPLELIFQSALYSEAPGLTIDLAAINLVEIGVLKFH